jgi:hypothetical protein
MTRVAIGLLLLCGAGCRFTVPGLDGSPEGSDGGAGADLHTGGDGPQPDFAGTIVDLTVPPGVDATLVCQAPHADCDNNPANGCEVDTDTDPQHCGGCAIACAFPNANVGCAGGKCTLTSCVNGFSDCNKNPTDGCEAALATDPKNCGACGNVCPMGGNGASCMNGVCSTLPPMDAALVGYWNLDDAGPMVKDASPNRNDGTSSGATAMAGKVGGAFHFNGAGCITIPDSTSIEMNNYSTMTMMAWARYTGGCGNATHGIVVSHEQGYEMGPLCGIMNSPDTFQAAIQPLNVLWNWYGTQSETLNGWQHVAVTYDGMNQRIYLDGALVDTNPLAGAMTNRLSGLGIGCRGVPGDGSAIGTYGFFLGELDEVALYSRALSSGEIAAYYNATK